MSDEQKQSMQIYAGSTEEGDVKVDFFHGPIMSSVIFSVTDEQPVLAIFQKAFQDARRVKAGETLEEVMESNRKESDRGHLQIV